MRITQPEWHSLHELVWMEAAMYEKFRLYRQQAEGSHLRELCDHLLARSRQHVTALARLLEAKLPPTDGHGGDAKSGNGYGAVRGTGHADSRGSEDVVGGNGVQGIDANESRSGMGEAAVLRDCLDTLKHASTCYLRASHEADSDRLRETFQSLAVDKGELKNAVFHLMHQRDLYETRPALEKDVGELRRQCEDLLQRIGAGAATAREQPGGRPVKV